MAKPDDDDVVMFEAWLDQNRDALWKFWKYPSLWEHAKKLIEEQEAWLGENMETLTWFMRHPKAWERVLKHVLGTSLKEQQTK